MPVSLLTAVWGASSDPPVSVTVTPGTTAPDESVALPKISPVCCADADDTTPNGASSVRKITHRRVIPILLKRIKR